MIQVWSGTEEYVLNSLQLMQNKAAKLVTRTVELYTPTRIILNQCGWLSVRQLGFFHSVLLLWKTIQHQEPAYLWSKLETTNTRSGAQGNLKIYPHRSTLASKAFFTRASLHWNAIPPDIRNITSIQTFKKHLKDYVKKNIPIA